MEKIIDMKTMQETLETTPISIVYLSMPNCSVCQAVKPRIPHLAIEKDVPAFHMDAFDVPEVAGVFQVMTAPAVLVFANGKELQRQARFIDFTKIAALIDQLKDSDQSINYEDLFR